MRRDTVFTIEIDTDLQGDRHYIISYGDGETVTADKATGGAIFARCDDTVHECIDHGDRYRLEHDVITAFRSCPAEMQDGICKMLGVEMNRGYGVRRVK